jgi:hypothetical protein
MILQALVQYYDRRCALGDPGEALARPGWERKQIPFLIEITPEGKTVREHRVEPAVGQRGVRPGGADPE